MDDRSPEPGHTATNALDTSRLGALELLCDAVVVTDREGRIALWNGAAAALFGWTAAEVLGESLDLIIPDKHRARHWDGYRRVMQTGRSSYADRLLEVPALRRDGQRISIAFTVSLVPGDGAPAGVIAVVRDDTSRRAELKELRDRLSG